MDAAHLLAQAFCWILSYSQVLINWLDLSYGGVGVLLRNLLCLQHKWVMVIISSKRSLLFGGDENLVNLSGKSPLLSHLSQDSSQGSALF